METLITSVTEGQREQIERLMRDAMRRAIAEGILDKDGAQKLVEKGDEFQTDIVASIKKH